MPEETPKEQGTPPPAPEEKPKGTEPEEPEKQETPPQPPETPDYKADLETEKTEHQKEKEAHTKTQDRLGKAEHKIETLKKFIKDEGMEPPEDKEGISEEAVRGIIQEEISKERNVLKEEISKLGRQLSETQRAALSKKTVSKGGGGAGQKPPQKIGMPTLSKGDEQIVRKAGLKWDPEKGEWIGKSGKRYPAKLPRGEVVQFGSELEK